MNDTVYECYCEAGKIAARVRKEAVLKIKETIPLLDIAEYVEERIHELGGKPAFPCNISINEIASHYTPENRLLRFKKGDVVKLDIGVHIEGFIADTAITIEVGTCNHARLIQASEEALEKAIRCVKHKANTKNIGCVIQETIKKHGFNPLPYLTGHNLERYKLHAGVTLPNYNSFFSQKIRKDMVIAIEPFATRGKGNIKYGKAHIFALSSNNKGYQDIRNKFGTLPFARRWVPGINPENMKGVRKYPELMEAEREVVVQSEHTVIVDENGCEVIT